MSVGTDPPYGHSSMFRIHVSDTWRSNWTLNALLTPYLGLHLDKRRTCRSHSEQVIHRLYQLRPTLCSDVITRSLGKLIVITYVIPTVTYALHV